MFRKRPAGAKTKAAKPLRARGGGSDADDDDDSSNEHGTASESGKNRPAASTAASVKGVSNVDASNSEPQQQHEHGSSSARGGDKCTSSSSSSSLHQVIEKTKRKRKLLTELQYKRGTDAAQLLVRRSVLHDDEPKEAGEGRDETSGSGSVGLVYKRKLDDDDPESNEPSYAEPTTVLERKHQQAMQEFIRRKLKEPSNTAATDSSASAAPGAPHASGMNEETVDGDSPSKISSSLLVQTDLFAELADQAKALQSAGGGASKVDKDGAAGAAGEHETAGVTAEDAGASAAAATSSTVMLHGTGIVEVILPTRSRAQQTTELVEAAEHKKRQQQQHRHRNTNKRQMQQNNHRDDNMGKEGSVPSSVPAAAVPKAQPHKLPSRPTASAILPSRFTTYQPPAAKMPPPPGHLQQQQQQQHESSAGGTRTDATAAAAALVGSTSEGADNDRPGFAEFQRKQHQHSSSAPRPPGSAAAPASSSGSSRPPQQTRQHPSNQQQRASDHVVYKKFVTHQQTLPNKKR
jgi:hypothetical protein